MNGLNQSKKIIHLVGKLNSEWDKQGSHALKKHWGELTFLRFVGSSPIAEISAAEQLIDIKSATSLRWDMAMDGAGMCRQNLGKPWIKLVSLAMNGLLDPDYPLVN